MSLVLDSGAVTALSRRDRHTAARISMLRHRGLWPPVVPTAVLVESLTGNGVRAALTTRLVRLRLSIRLMSRSLVVRLCCAVKLALGRRWTRLS